MLCADGKYFLTDFFFFFLIALSSSFVHSVSPLSPNAWWVKQEKTVNFLYPLLCTFSTFGRVCTRSEPLSTLWFETWARKYQGFTWHRWVTAESLFPPGKKNALCLCSCSYAHSFTHGAAAISGLEKTLVPSWAEPQRTCFPPDLVALLVEPFCVWASAQKVLGRKNFPSFLWWARRFERPYLNFIKVLDCPFNLLLLFCVCSTILLCLAHDLTPPAAAGDVRSLLSSTPRQIINTREVFDAANFRELWEVGMRASGYKDESKKGRAGWKQLSGRVLCFKEWGGF